MEYIFIESLLAPLEWMSQLLLLRIFIECVFFFVFCKLNWLIIIQVQECFPPPIYVYVHYRRTMIIIINLLYFHFISNNVIAVNRCDDLIHSHNQTCNVCVILHILSRLFDVEISIRWVVTQIYLILFILSLPLMHERRTLDGVTKMKMFYWI